MALTSEVSNILKCKLLQCVNAIGNKLKVSLYFMQSSVHGKNAKSSASSFNTAP